jgi:predicted RNase H-like HicB family nuclease
MTFSAVFEQTDTGYSAYSPDIEGLGVTGKTLEETRARLTDAIAFYLQECKADGLPAPARHTVVDSIVIAA